MNLPFAVDRKARDYFEIPVEAEEPESDHRENKYLPVQPIPFRDLNILVTTILYQVRTSLHNSRKNLRYEVGRFKDRLTTKYEHYANLNHIKSILEITPLNHMCESHQSLRYSMVGQSGHEMRTVSPPTQPVIAQDDDSEENESPRKKRTITITEA